MPFNTMPMPRNVYGSPNSGDPSGQGGGAVTPMPMPRMGGGGRFRAPLGPMPRPGGGQGGGYNPGNPPPFLPGAPFGGSPYPWNGGSMPSGPRDPQIVGPGNPMYDFMRQIGLFPGSSPYTPMGPSGGGSMNSPSMGQSDQLRTLAQALGAMFSGQGNNGGF